MSGPPRQAKTRGGLARTISRDSVFRGRRFGQRVVLATRQLRPFPESGRMIPAADERALREIIVQGYRIMYRLEPDRVLILAVITARDLMGARGKPSDEE